MCASTPNTAPDSADATAPPVHVAVGILRDGSGQILTALRPARLHQGNLWEFPGGKLEAGENVLQALHRELHEELDVRIDIATCTPLKKVLHHYPDKSVLLDVWQVRDFTGDPHGREGQPLRWQSAPSLNPAEFPAADLAIIRALQLPERIAISGRFATLEELDRALTMLAARGLQQCQLRMPAAGAEALLRCAAHAQNRCEELRLSLQVNTHPDLLCRLPETAGLHVNASVLMSLARRPVSESRLFSASCHNLAELQQAGKLNADFVLLSPVQATPSHPGTALLGWEGFRSLLAQASVPVYALGGLADPDLPRARQEGALGIAAISAWWPERD